LGWERFFVWWTQPSSIRAGGGGQRICRMRAGEAVRLAFGTTDAWLRDNRASRQHCPVAPYPMPCRSAVRERTPVRVKELFWLRLRLVRRRRGGKAGPDVFLGTVWWKPRGAGSTTNEKITLRVRFNPLPLEEYRFGAALAANDADRLALNKLHFRIYARSRPIAKSVTDNLREVKHKLIIAIELVVLNSDN